MIEMTVLLDQMSFKTSGETDLIDMTATVREKIAVGGIDAGVAVIFVPGSTAGVTTIEYESGVLNDLTRAIRKLAPEGDHYDHDERWGDGNGYSHVRAALLGPSLSVPIQNGRLVLGTWQQIVLCDFDNRPRERRVIIQVIGESSV